MSNMSPALVISLMVTIACALAMIPVYLLTRRPGQAKRLMEVTRAPLRLEEEPAERENPAKLVFLAVVRFVRTRLGLAQDEKLRQKLFAAGLRDSSTADTYFAIRLLGPVVAVVAATFIRSNTFFWVAALMVAAYMAPDFWVDYQAHKRRERIRLGLPDALDLMVVCVDAGLAIDQALLRAGQELALSQPEISEEFLQINFEQRAGKPRIEAWQSMAERTKVETVESFVHMLAQTDRFGTPSGEGAARLCRRRAAEAPPAGRRDGGQDHREADFPSGAVHLSQHLHRAAGAGDDPHNQKPERPFPIGPVERKGASHGYR